MPWDSKHRRDLFPLGTALTLGLDAFDFWIRDQICRTDAVGLMCDHPGSGLEDANVLEVGQRDLNLLQSVKLVAEEEINGIHPDEVAEIVFA